MKILLPLLLLATALFARGHGTEPWECPYDRSELWQQMAIMADTQQLTQRDVARVLSAAVDKCVPHNQVGPIGEWIMHHCDVDESTVLTEADWQAPASCVPRHSELERHVCMFVLCYQHLVSKTLV